MDDIHESGENVARSSQSGSESIADSGTASIRLHQSGSEAIADSGTVSMHFGQAGIEAVIDPTGRVIYRQLVDVGLTMSDHIEVTVHPAEAQAQPPAPTVVVSGKVSFGLSLAVALAILEPIFQAQWKLIPDGDTDAVIELAVIQIATVALVIVVLALAFGRKRE
jgi:hypothetical protein